MITTWKNTWFLWNFL